MRRLIWGAVIATVMAGAGCRKVGSGQYEFQRPVFGTRTDTARVPTVDVVTDSTKIMVPKVDIKKESATVKVPRLEVHRPPEKRGG